MRNKKLKHATLVFIVLLVVSCLLINSRKFLLINGHFAPFTQKEIQLFYELDPMTSKSCKNDPSGQKCLAVWNKCNGNPKKPEVDKVIGCFDHFELTASGTLLIHLTGFDGNMNKYYSR